MISYNIWLISIGFREELFFLNPFRPLIPKRERLLMKRQAKKGNSNFKSNKILFQKVPKQTPIDLLYKRGRSHCFGWLEKEGVEEFFWRREAKR